MAQLLLDNMDNASAWDGFEADGTTPSAELTLSDDTTRTRFDPSGTSGLISASVNAAGHMLRRPLADLDLTDYDQLHLSIFANRRANGSSTHPFYLEVRLASAGMDFSDPGNTWLRYIPVIHTDRWESVRLSLDDLPPAVRTAVNLLQIRCVDATVAFNCNLDHILAVRDEMLGDVDSALYERLHNQFTLNSVPVPGILYIAGSSPPANKPYILITHYSIRFSGDRACSTRVFGDFNAEGYRIRPQAYAYDVFYTVEVSADDRHDEAAVLEFVLQAMPPSGELIINGNPVPFELITPPPQDGLTGFPVDRPLIHYKVAVRQEVGAYQVVRPVDQVVTVVDIETG